MFDVIAPLSYILNKYMKLGKTFQGEINGPKERYDFSKTINHS